ncbi:hypothetical protein [Denitrificimonas halotolerans]|uniref:hypothetical protein n=1 Tax=Denitrificimonas halotolerans TaxID=3098930 RepID=UPI0038995453
MVASPLNLTNLVDRGGAIYAGNASRSKLVKTKMANSVLDAGDAGDAGWGQLVKSNTGL